YADFVLPASLVTRLDLSRLLIDLERLDNELTTSTVREKVDSSRAAQPVIPEQLEEFLRLNNLDLDDTNERSYLIRQLRILKDKAPVVHMTFASTADRESLIKLADWLRQSAHPQTVLTVGLQPSLVAGVSVRTPNRVHDFSLRRALVGQHDKLVKQLEALGGKG